MWGWQHTHRLSSGDRLSVKNEQFWLSISANLYIIWAYETNIHTHIYAHVYKQTKREIQESGWVRANIGKSRGNTLILSHTGEMFVLKHKIKQTISTVKLLSSVKATCGLLVLWTATEQRAVHKHLADKTAKWQIFHKVPAIKVSTKRDNKILMKYIKKCAVLEHHGQQLRLWGKGDGVSVWLFRTKDNALVLHYVLLTVSGQLQCARCSVSCLSQISQTKNCCSREKLCEVC